MKRAGTGGLDAAPMKTIAVVLGVLSAVTSGVPCQDFEDRRVVSPSGRRYAVVREAVFDVTFELCERAPGAPPMTAARRCFGREGPGFDIERDPADVVLAEGRCAQHPTDVIVPDRVAGLLLFDYLGFFHPHRVVTWIGADGTERFVLRLREVFGEAELGGSVNSIGYHWCRNHAFDDAKSALLVVAYSGEVREIAIPAGTVATPDARRLAEFARAGSEAARCLAFDVFAQRPPAATKEVLPIASGVFHDRSEPMAVRLRAAVALHRAGVKPPAAELFAAARAGDQPDSMRSYAVQYLPTVLGEAAIPVLREVVRAGGGDAWNGYQVSWAAYQALAAIGEPAVPTLLEMLEERDRNSDYRGGAVHALAAIRSPSALAALLRVAREHDEYVAAAALDAIVAIRGPSLVADLVALLETAPLLGPRIVSYFEDHPTRAALPALDALERVTEGLQRRCVKDAILACRR